MKQRTKVLGPQNGSLESPLVFIAEAPGRLGADKFGVPLYGDQTGRNFEILLRAAGLTREMVFITNAVLCNPRTAEGNNASPKPLEIQNCCKHLKKTLDIIWPKYIVTLGAIALSALNNISPHDIRLSKNVGKLFRWNGFQIYPLYHPGPRALIWRSRIQQIEDYRSLASLIR